MASVSRANSLNAQNNGNDDHQHIRLACQACQRKKIKCDRNFPCGQCTRSSLQCVPSTRKPRTRHAGKRAVDSELRNRITKLESLVESLSGEIALPDDLAGTSDGPAKGPIKPAELTDVASPAVGKYIGSPFWSSLTAEVQGLRDALEEHDDIDDEPTSPTTPSSNGGQPGGNEYDLIVCPPTSVYVMPGAIDEPKAHVQAALFEIFVRNISPMFKIFHGPTVRNTMERGASYLGDQANSLPVRTLRAAMWMAALNSLTDGECQARFGHRRTDLIQKYKRVTEVLLTQVDLCNTNSIATLQAFILYLAAVRMADHSRRAWTLIPIAVRIARAMGLDHEQPGQSPYENELRRRTFHQLRFIDVFTAMDRGTEVLITNGSFSTPLPNNVNDSEFDESSSAIPNHETGLTDMAFGLLAMEAASLTQHLSVAESSPTGETWQQRLELAENFRKLIRERYIQHCDMSIPYHRMISAVGNSMGYSMILRAVRPIQRHVSSVPPRVDSPYVLQLATDSLRNNEKIYQDPEGGGWRWLIWVQWHAIAVALAGLCSIRDGALADDAWEAVEVAHARYEKHVADTKNGMLWRPIEKLYKKASAFRDEGKRQSLDETPSKPRLQMTHEPRQVDSLSNASTNIIPWMDIQTATIHARTHQYQHQRQLSQTSMPLGPLPTENTFQNLPMDFNGFSGPNDSTLASLSQALNKSNLTSSAVRQSPTMQPNGGDMSWMDWERIMDDFNSIPIDNMTNGFDMVPNMGDMPLYSDGISGLQPDGATMPDTFDVASGQYGTHGFVNTGTVQQPGQTGNGQSWII